MISERLLAPFGKPRVRITIVLLLAALSLATALPNYIYIVFPIYGHFGFVTDERGRVLVSFRPNLKIGDVIEWRALPFDKRYDTGEFGRMARAGTRIVFPVIRDGRRVDVPLVSEFHRERFGGAGALWLFSIKKGAELLIVLLGAALVLIRPSRISWLFFIYAAALGADGAPFWSFLPAWMFTTASLFAGILSIPLPAAALTLFALELPGHRERWKQTVKQTALLLFLLSSAALVGWIVRDYFAIPLGSWISTTAVLSTLLLWTSANVVLTTTGLRALRAHTYPLACVCAALCGSALCYAYVDAADLAGGQALPTPDYWGLFSLLLSLAAVYSILSGRIIDARFVITRAALSAAIGCCTIALFALLNLAFATQIARVGFIIPIEIVVAALLGFRLSGLQDVAAAINLVSSDAASARISGDRTTEHDALVRALARAERTGNAGLIANVRAHAAFGEWFWGADNEFERHIRALDGIVGRAPMRGLRRFAECARAAAFQSLPDRAELPEWTARTELLACGQSNDSLDAKHHAELALTAAESSKDSFLIAIAAVALAEFDVELRRRLYERAEQRCKDAGSLCLFEAVRALSTGNERLGLLDQFVNRRLRADRGARPTFEIRFADASVRRCGQVMDLRPRELAVLLLIAHTAGGASFDRLSDELWPDLDGDAARNVLRVNLHRLRKALGDEEVIAKGDSRYRLRRGSMVDIWRFEESVTSLTRARILTPEQRNHLDDMFNKLRAGKEHRPLEEAWFYTIEQHIARLTREAGRLLADDALRQGDYTRAVRVASELLEDDPGDEIGSEIVIRARLACGDSTGALATYREYREAIASASLARPSAKIEELAAEMRAGVGLDKLGRPSTSSG